MAWRTDVEGQSVIVVGAASGIGLACAKQLLDRGATVYGLDVDEASLDGELGSACTTAFLDVTDEASCREQFGKIFAEAGQVHALLNCAGITGQTGKRTHEVEFPDFARVVDVNLQGALRVSIQAIPHMISQAYGRIVHIASISGKEGNAGMAAYSASKAGLIGLIKVMGKEYARDGLVINGIAPAVIRTPMVDALPAEQVEYMTDKIPMNRCGTLEEIADLATWALSPACSFTTGFTFDLSGGRAVY